MGVGKGAETAPASPISCLILSGRWLTMKVRMMIKLLELDGWELARQVGSHRQFRQPSKPGTVTVAGKLRQGLKRGTLSSILRQADLKGDQN
jgi:predicted RNA binding protein YcfA (HicA-like mRNA interferase family)